MKFYAGIGSRETPAFVQDAMVGIAAWMAERGVWLRSGGARGADSAFAFGAQGRSVIFRRGSATEKAYEYGEEFHPAWDLCTPEAKALHARNAHIILGPGLDDSVKFVVCWTPGGLGGGGTGQALRIAEFYGIPILDLGRPSVEAALAKEFDGSLFGADRNLDARLSECIGQLVGDG